MVGEESSAAPNLLLQQPFATMTVMTNDEEDTVNCIDCGQEAKTVVCPPCQLRRAILQIPISQPLPRTSKLDIMIQIAEESGMYDKTAEPKRTR